MIGANLDRCHAARRNVLDEDAFVLEIRKVYAQCNRTYAGPLEVRPQVYEAREIVAAYSVTVGTSKGTPAGAFLLKCVATRTEPKPAGLHLSEAVYSMK